MKVIGAGFGRTGTKSLQAALVQLGLGPCYHMTEVLAHIEHADIWMEAGRGGHVDWDALLQGYQSGVDFPICDFYEQLMERYPDAKVLLSVRDPEKWYESCLKTIYAITNDLPMRWVGPYVPRIGKVNRLARTLVWEGRFGGRFLDKEHALRIYHDHIKEVKRRVPPERLLVFDVKEGWGPLCAFLGVPVPEGPFPRLNDTAEFQRNVRRAKVMGWATLALPALLVGAGIYAATRRR